ncbi:MAG: hypothetical protein ACTTI5_08125 [Treponema sp.]
MKSVWIIDDDVFNKIKKIVDENINSEIAKERMNKNINKIGIDISKNNVWKVLIGCEITTQQKSGKWSVTDKFLNSNSKLLDFDYCKKQDISFISKELQTAGLRRYEKISEWLIQIIQEWESGEWDILLDKLSSINKNHTKDDEKEVISYLMSGKYKGLGLKQSRNFLQWLGLSEYEIPIDSRARKVLKDCGCNFVPGVSALQDKVTYEYLEKGMQLVSERLNIKPCILDACFFASLEN